jgi:hypothetical protein
VLDNRPAAPHDESKLLAALPRSEAVDTKQFASVIVCARCHQANATDLRDRQHRDISPVTELQAGMMSLSARDPYFLAALRREIDAQPARKTEIEAICLRCHAPVGFTEAPLTIDDVERATTPAAHLAREGVGCHGCHALDPQAKDAVVLRTDRVSFGSLPAPLVDAMVQMSNTRPVPSAHVEESALCATCHTVIVGGVVEQATYLEWLSSDFAPRTTCQACHMPPGEDELDRDAKPIITAFSTRPPDAPPRPSYRRHTLRGGNTYMLRQMAKSTAWLNAAATPEQLASAADATTAFLGTAAKLRLVGVGQELRVTITNLTGHKLPTGYPTRRMWLHVRATDAAGNAVFESGATRDGAIIDSEGKRLDDAIIPHVDRPSADEPPIWEAVPVDANGKRTHLLMSTVKLVKDNRIPPEGFTGADPRTLPVGVDGDTDFLPGHDSVMYVLPATAVSATAELLYQAVPPETIESYPPESSREAARFRAICDVPPAPVVLASDSVTLQATP